MYNIHNHYNNIYHLARTIIAEPSLVYLYPFGSSSSENIEVIGSDQNFPDTMYNNFIIGYHARTGPVLLCYDQEPLIHAFNRSLIDHVQDNFVWGPKVPKIPFDQDVIFLNTELDSDEKDLILAHHNVKDCYYFFHAFAAHDWFRGYQFLHQLTPPLKRKIKKKFITFNRITSNARVYRSLLVNELIKHQILDQGHASFSVVCPDTEARFDSELERLAKSLNIPDQVVQATIENVNRTHEDKFRIDHKDDAFIPNNSFHLSAIKENMESFVHVVTETCYWGRKKHLTEKIFKPIVMRQPFILVGCAHNLEYLKSYGFKTFDRWWDESYDQIEDDVERMHAIGQILANICQNDTTQLTNILRDMNEVLEHNYNWFHNPEFLNNCWNELVENLTAAIKSKP